MKNLAELRARCEAAGYPTVDDEPLPGYDRFYVHDPFGNRIECLEPRGRVAVAPEGAQATFSGKQPSEPARISS